MGIVVIGAVFVDIKGFPEDIYVPEGRNAGRIEYIHGGVTRNVVEDSVNRLNNYELLMNLIICRHLLININTSWSNRC